MVSRPLNANASGDVAESFGGEDLQRVGGIDNLNVVADYPQS